ncbi:hypothetical protein N9B17_04845 [Rhodopirellula sp.]|nr:hypothetical protein [Rhodopirellula sp.]MDB4770625.1 hypothetical protein [bacterium]
MIKSSLFKSRGVRESGGTERVVVSWLGPRVNIVSAAVRCFYRGDTVSLVVVWRAPTPAVLPALERILSGFAAVGTKLRARRQFGHSFSPNEALVVLYLPLWAHLKSAD